MNLRMIVVGLGGALLLGLVIGGGTTEGTGATGGGDGSVTAIGVENLEMLESDRMMLERMRASTSQSMMTMIREDPMWRDEGMIQAQEEYQAQLDRMLGKRQSGP